MTYQAFQILDGINPEKVRNFLNPPCITARGLN